MSERDEIIDALYDTDEIHRPPIEEGSALLELTRGCSWGRCRYCDFPRDGFSVIDMAEVGRKMTMLAKIIGGRTRLHLTGCDPLCLPTPYLEQVLSRVSSTLPTVSEVSMYARADEVAKKSGEELESLRARGLTDLHIGVESGSARVLEMHDKGETPEMMAREFRRLEGAGISYHVSIIPGLGGRALSDEHADATAAFLSRIRPISIWCIGIKIWPGTPLEEMARRGEFEPMTWREILAEERRMAAALEMSMPCAYVDSTVLGRYTIAAPLPDGRAWLLDRMDALLAESVDEI